MPAHYYPSLINFVKSYARIHGHISICVCIFGIITNIFNITILTQINMQTPVNNILTWLAISDIITMLSYIPFALHFYCLYEPLKLSPEKNNKPWMTFMLFHMNLTNTTHTISIWLCVLLAIIRYAHIRSPAQGEAIRLKRIKQSQIYIFSVYLLSIIIMVPTFICNKITAVQLNFSNQTIYLPKDLNLAKPNTTTTVAVTVGLYAVTAKLLPCGLMGIFGTLLIYTIHKRSCKRMRMILISGTNKYCFKEHSRTTKMLLAVIVLFLITELPQGVLIVLSNMMENVFDYIYVPLGDIMDIMALVNNAVNFVLYCTMSSKFRKNFINLYWHSILHRN